MKTANPKWRERLKREVAAGTKWREMSEDELRREFGMRTITSSNHDTVIAINWPHYCVGATSGCGGPSGWCYTFQGHQALKNHHPKVAFNDAAARRLPNEFGAKVASEVHNMVNKSALPYPNLRFSGSGEATLAHLPALAAIMKQGVHLWGFSRNLALAIELRAAGAAVIFSCDKTTPTSTVSQVIAARLPLAYSSCDVTDKPPDSALVTFPLHRSGRVKEVVDCRSLCPKVLEEYSHGDRQPAACQWRCTRCHQLNECDK